MRTNAGGDVLRRLADLPDGTLITTAHSDELGVVERIGDVLAVRDARGLALVDPNELVDVVSLTRVWREQLDATIEGNA